nr:MAG TPA: hypothetical protein [Caudoviricetes sp.]
MILRGLRVLSSRLCTNLCTNFSRQQFFCPQKFWLTYQSCTNF